MKATELRLGTHINLGGNTLETCQTYKPVRVTLAILNEIARENEKRPDAELSVFQPIPLTEEWLQKFGFIKRLGRFYSNGGHIHYSTGMRLYRPSPCIEVKYVHQLQNLYFALTGTELEIKL